MDSGVHALQEYTWPGNVRQLQHVVERLTILADRIDSETVDDALTAMESRDKPVETLADAEEDQIRQVLAATGGNKSKAAQILGIERKTLYRKLERMKPVIDIHSHILPGLDDGATTLEESVAMVRMAAAAGHHRHCRHPACQPGVRLRPGCVVERKIGELQAAVGDAPRIHFGCDFHLTPENIDDALRSPGEVLHRSPGLPAGGVLRLLTSRRPPMKSSAASCEARLRPIVTHPERNQLLRNRLGGIGGVGRAGSVSAGDRAIVPGAVRPHRQARQLTN